MPRLDPVDVTVVNWKIMNVQARICPSVLDAVIYSQGHEDYYPEGATMLVVHSRVFVSMPSKRYFDI
jgi:hypothetical protein